MAAKLDTSTITTSSAAFLHPLPQVRQFHRSLTQSLDEKNARLRTLVGGSYRQLLGTAEMILDMRVDIEEVEDKLGRVGKGCGSSVVSGKARGLRALGVKGESGLEGVTRVKTLEMCALSASRLLRSGGEDVDVGKKLITAAKVLVLARLLAKGVSEGEGEEVKWKLERLKKKLARGVKKTLEKVGEGDERRDNLVQALCAYSLANSSGAKDVLRYFLHARGEAMALAFSEDDNATRDTSAVLKALHLYTRTLLDVQSLVPRRLREALEGLKTKPLLKDESVRELEGLRLDVSERWFGDQIRFFTPYNRHDDLDGPLAVETLRSWARKASEVLLQGFGNTLTRTVEFKTVVELRTKILEVWIKDGGKAKGFDPSVVLDGFRKIINDRMLELLEARVNKLHLVGTEIEGTLGDWRPGITDHHDILWSPDMLVMDISNGALAFKQSVLARTHGRNNAVSKAVSGYHVWRNLVDEIATSIEQLKKQRWDDDLEDIEDDLSIESRSALLSQDDPKLLQEHLETGLGTAYFNLEAKITTLLATYQQSVHIGQMSIYILRVCRDIRSDVPANISTQAFGLTLITSLHKTLAALISQTSVEKYGDPFNRRKVVGRALWEGEPQLPVQPSPKVYSFLHRLTASMGEVGSDVWSKSAVQVLKLHLRAELGARLRISLENLGKERLSEADGKEKKEDVDCVKGEEVIQSEIVSEDKPAEAMSQTVDPNTKREVLIQSLFDIYVLETSLDGRPGQGDDLQATKERLESQLELESSSQKKLQSGASEYWKRTSLLFGLLA